jgi:SOS-response transcriptional repressor LexA
MKNEEQEPTGVSAHTGFPNPAIDSSLRSLDLNQLLIKHGASTYFFRVRGDHWQEAGVFDGDLAIVDRALDPRSTDTVIWWNKDSDEFSISIYKKMPPDATLWGVIRATVHDFRPEPAPSISA